METWRDIPGYEGLYQVSDRGHVRSIDRWVISSTGRRYVVRGRLMKCQRNVARNGYVEVNLVDRLGNRKCNKAHRLVAKAFIPNPYGLPQVNHKNGRTDDNSLMNLEWVTGSENLRHTFTVLGHRRTSQQKRLLFIGGDRTCFLMPHSQYAADVLGVSRASISSALRFGHKCRGYEVCYG